MREPITLAVMTQMTPPPPVCDRPMDDKRLTGILTFLQSAEQLKDTIRSGSTRKGRPESTAEHSWRLALMVLLLEKELTGIDFLKLLKLCLIHDLGEAISGDIPAPDQQPGDDRQQRERRDFQTLCTSLPEDLAGNLIDLWDEYAKAASVEARFAKAFDKLETIFQHLLMPPPGASFYEFNLTYGRDRTDYHPLTRQVRERADDGTREMIRGLEGESSRSSTNLAVDEQ
ncbi:HD domain-containing protein [Roseibium marinum]|uniref:5'-deoxynucleotidase n=1 Tax=Roseibium marinum TaxID=281252 RepID=A0A2S3UJZ6_9HYPH|nr:HD domain-containing protein [Roseibium marinum]POF28052.1 putative hydrolase of HD superfamily [Roseibium marinum]